jgi:adenosine deaminase CECR1
MISRHDVLRARLILLCVVSLAAGCASSSGPSRPPQQTSTELAAYTAARERLVAEERALRLGAQLALSADEEAAARRLMKLKAAELARTRDRFAPATSFLLEDTKRLYEDSAVFNVVRRMPKGGVLHAHFTAMGDFQWIAARAIASPRTFVQTTGEPGSPEGSLRFADHSPGPNWRRLSDLRAAAADPGAFDAGIFHALTFGEEDLAAPDIWAEFVDIFARTRGLFADRTFTADFFDHLVATLVSDNVQYLELRSAPVEEAWIEKARRHDGAFDVKFIPAVGRSTERDQVSRVLESLVSQRHERPDRVKGFDLVQEEDSGNTNFYYIDELLAARRTAQQRGTDMPFYLHSGESNWAENENLYDAVLLGAPRIGHALALFRHPLLLREVKARDIAIEVCPISNQVLGYVADLRTHPAAHYINSGLPVVLSSDDPGIFRSSLSHDYFVAFMAWGLDLKALKQLAINSLQYSTMTAAEKSRAMAAWQERWTAFIAWVNANHPDA